MQTENYYRRMTDNIAHGPFGAVIKARGQKRLEAAVKAHWDGLSPEDRAYYTSGNAARDDAFNRAFNS